MNKKYLKKLVGQRVFESKAYHPLEDRKDFVKLDLNESYFFLNKKIITELKKFDYFTLSSYPEYRDLIHSLAKYSHTKPKEVFLTSGSDHAIQIILSLFFHEGDEVVIPAPTFFVYFSILNLIGAKPKTIYYEEINKKFIFPFQKTLDALNKNSKGLLLCNPNNPLGSSIPKNQIVALLKKTSKLHIPLIIDEAYFEFSGESAVKLLRQYDNLIIIRSFSKSFGLAGLRLGYVLTHKNIVEELMKLRLPWAINHFAVHAGKVVLKHVKYFKEKIKESLVLKKDLFVFLEKMGFKVRETDTNFILVNGASHPHLAEKLKSLKILTSNVSKYPFSNDLLADTLRINIPSKIDSNVLKKGIIS